MVRHVHTDRNTLNVSQVLSVEEDETEVALQKANVWQDAWVVIASLQKASLSFQFHLRLEKFSSVEQFQDDADSCSGIVLAYVDRDFVEVALSESCPAQPQVSLPIWISAVNGR